MPAQELTEKEKSEFFKQATSGLIVVPGEIFQRAVTLVPSTAQTDLSVDMAPLKGLPARVGGKPTEADLELINRFAPSGQVDPESIYCFNTAPSTQRIDSHFTRMDISSLQNYANEAMAGTPVMNSHKTGGWLSDAQLPIGRSFWGGVENAPDGNGKRFVSAAYMRRGSTSNGETNTDSIIGDIDAGVIGDVSIGFALLPGTPENNFQDRSWLKCSICGQDWLSSDPWSDDPDDCQHWPGQIYKSDGGKQQDLCFLDVMNGHLREYSPCYAGSTPGAVILKAKRSVESGRLDRSLIRQLEDSYHVRLVERAVFPVPVLEATPVPMQVEVPVIQPRTDEINTQAGAGDPPSISSDEDEIERTKEQAMANKRDLENASKEGAKHALAELARSIMASPDRDFTDEELALFPQIESRLAAGELEAANSLMMRLINPQSGEGESPLETRIESESNSESEGGEDGEAQPGQSSIVSLSLSVNERQQFEAMKRDNARYRLEIERLTPLAETGEHYLEVLREETCKQAVRAQMGSEEETLDMLQRLPVEQVERIYKQYKALGDSRLSQVDLDGLPIFAGGRQTTPGDPNRPAFQNGQVVQLPSRNIDTSFYSSRNGNGSSRR